MIGKVLGDRYEILEKIGGGGMALVYKAKCGLLNRFVAIKVLRTEFTDDEDFIKKFKRESQSAASLSHPNIVSIYDVGTQEDIYYIVMEYVKGQTLKDLIKAKGALGTEYATSIALQISAAIDHAHKNHIVHRDIKSHNILIKDDSSAKVTDFGIARAVSSSTITNTGNVIGSVHYFSPEQARGGYTDEKSDIYSLGIVMYEMVTGRLPFEGESPIAIALKHIQEEPIRPTKINPKLPKSIEDIILKCMEKDTNMRYDNAEEIISDLKQSMVMPNGDFVKKKKVFNDGDTIIMEPVKLEMAVNNQIAQTAAGEMEKTRMSERIEKAEEKPAKQSFMKKHRAAVFTIVGGVLLALILGLGFIFINSLFITKEVVVPDLVNLSEEDARTKLKEMSLVLEITDRVYNKDIVEGQIISQNPKAGDKNKTSNPVRVVLSRGPRKVTVPSLVGENYDKVNLILEREGLKEGNLVQEYSDTYANGLVIRQNITAGIPVDEGTAIDYVVSMGQEKIPMPNYIGLNIEDVKSDLMQKDLILGNITYESSTDYTANTVMSQNIKSGTIVNRKSIIDFTISKGVQDSTTPTSFKLKVPLPQNLEQMKVTIYKVQNDTSKNIYENTHASSDSPLYIPVSGQGDVTFEVYINDSLYNRFNVKF